VREAMSILSEKEASRVDAGFGVDSEPKRPTTENGCVKPRAPLRYFGDRLTP
jgi:hypothetical protein